MDIEWKKRRSDMLISDRWIDIRGDYYEMPDGREVGPFYTYHKQDFAVIVATDCDGNYICVNQFRQGIQGITTEFVAGGIESSDCESGNTEDAALAAAMRELAEEAGYESDEWTHIITVPSNATISDNYVHIFQAVNCRKVCCQSLDITEFINVEVLTPDELKSMVQGGSFKQTIHMLAWYMTQNR